ncbi:MAG TPA: hypothetical protein VHB21_16915, partial [Minicystis sp.]|nr:hypothetical protein [Minicystis sp.]
GAGGAAPLPNPFAAGQHWLGTYTCEQGLTELDLRIVAVQGDDIGDGVFAYTWGDVVGSYHVTGTFEPATASAKFVPGAWIDQPAGWTSVGMLGTVDAAMTTYAGDITYAGCGTFSVIRQ